MLSDTPFKHAEITRVHRALEIHVSICWFYRPKPRKSEQSPEPVDERRTE
jgi:hypothetical protein